MFKKKIDNLLIGSNNQGKIDEFKELLPKSVKIHSAKAYNLSSPIENRKTFRGNSLLKKIIITLKLPFQIIKCAYIIYKNKIETIIGFGGFITIPICTAGFIMGKSIYVHEQNSVVGSANRFVSKFAKKVFLGMSLNKDIKNSLLIGNPLRKSFKPIKTNRPIDLKKIIPF